MWVFEYNAFSIILTLELQEKEKLQYRYSIFSYIMWSESNTIQQFISEIFSIIWINLGQFPWTENHRSLRRYFLLCEYHYAIQHSSGTARHHQKKYGVCKRCLLSQMFQEMFASLLLPNDIVNTKNICIHYVFMLAYILLFYSQQPPVKY